MHIIVGVLGIAFIVGGILPNAQYRAGGMISGRGTPMPARYGRPLFIAGGVFMLVSAVADAIGPSKLADRFQRIADVELATLVCVSGVLVVTHTIRVYRRPNQPAPYPRYVVMLNCVFGGCLAVGGLVVLLYEVLHH